MPMTPHPDDDVMALFPQRQKVGKRARRILEIAIELKSCVAFRKAISSEDRILEPEVASEPNHLHARVDAGDVSQNF
jgi:hypothetical protein